MEDFLVRFAPWIFQTIITVAAVMVWGRVQDKFIAMQATITSLTVTVKDVKKESDGIVENYKTRFEASTSNVNRVEMSIMKEIGDLKTFLDTKYVSKEIFAMHNLIKGE